MKVAMINGMGRVWSEFSPDILESTDPKKTVGGGEAAMLRTAFGLAANHGHQVTAYVPLAGAAEQAEQFYKGVRFRPVEARGEAIEDGTDAIVSWSDDQILLASAKRSPSQRRVFSQQLNDMPEDLDSWKAIDIIISPAKAHAEYLVHTFAPTGAPFRFVFMPSGIDTFRFADQPKWSDRPLKVGYWSSPDRGLHHLLAGWADVQAALPFDPDQPDPTLDVFYHLDKFARQFKEEDWRWGGEIAWRAALLREQIGTVDFRMHGAVSRARLAETQKLCRVMAYPYDPVTFTESFATAIGEALAAGCRVVARPDDAIRDVWGGSVRWIEADVCDGKFRKRFAAAVADALTADEWPESVAASAVLQKYTWANASERVNRAITINPLPPAVLKP